MWFEATTLRLQVESTNQYATQPINMKFMYIHTRRNTLYKKLRMEKKKKKNKKKTKTKKKQKKKRI